jgi:hypothetical protein
MPFQPLVDRLKILELDFNPVRLCAKGAVTLVVRVIMKPQSA